VLDGSVGSQESAAHRHDEGGEETDNPTRNSRGNAKLEDGKPCRGRIGEKANNQPDDRPDRAH